MFGEQGWGGNNGGNQVNVSTRFTTSVSETSMMTIGGWNNNLSLRITPAVGVDANGNRMYDRNRAFQTALTQENAKALYLLYHEKIQPLIEANTPEAVNVGVPIGRDQKRSIASLEMVPVENGYDMYLVCYSSLDQNNAAQEANTFRHKFKKTVGVIGYQSSTGNGELTEVHSDFDNFIDRLKDIGGLLPVAAHGIKFADASSNAYQSRRGGQGGGSSYGAGGGFGGGMSMPSPTGGNYSASELPFV